MGLNLESITFANFRNYETFSLENLGMLTVLVGPNGIGKTNVVEGIQLLTALYSFRHPTLEQLLKDGEGEGFLSADVTDGNRLLSVSLNIRNHTKRYALNGKQKKAQELKGLLPAVSFTPDDLDLVKGPMSTRRISLDSLGSQLSANHYLIRKDYEKVLRYKNRLLKEESSPELLASMDEMIVKCGAQLVCYRVALLRKLIPSFIGHYEALSLGKESLSVCYLPSWADSPNLSGDRVDDLRGNLVFHSSDMDGFSLSRDVARETLSSALVKKRSEELARKKAVVGPHADRFEFYLNGKNAALYGSQGQQRSIVLAFKLAEADVIEEVLGQKPVMLLDDVMSELDAHRREALVDFVVRDVQTFITTANLKYFERKILDKANVVELGRTESVSL